MANEKLHQFSKGTVGFPSTLWTDISRWKRASQEEKSDLLGQFYKRYRLPLINFLYSLGYSQSDAEDLLHNFVIQHIKGKIFIAADPTKGRFRNLLLSSLKNFVFSQSRAEKAEKRRPREGFAFIDAEIFEGVTLGDLIPDNRTPEKIYEHTWLLLLLGNVLERLRKEYNKKGQSRHFILFERRVIHPILSGVEKPSVKDLARELGLSESKASNYIVTAKRGYQRHLRDEISEYVCTEKEISEEINDFQYFLQNLH